MTKMMMQIRWLMVMSRVRSWGEFTLMFFMRFFIQSSYLLRGMVTGSNAKYFFNMFKRSRR